MRKVGILPNARKDTHYSATKRLVSFLLKEGCIPMLNESLGHIKEFRDYCVKEEILYKESEFLIALGGDGTMLSCGKKASKYGTPLLGINLGHLGFLTDGGKEGMEASVKNVLLGNYKLEKRMMLQSEINSSKEGKRVAIALNEVSIARGSMVDVGVYINDEFIDNFFGDGILVSTPTGSTAYNLAAGGPILKSDADIVAITPICPHMLHSRSIVIGASDIIMLKVNRYTRQKIFAVIDGQNNCTLETGDTIIIKKSKFYAGIIKTGDLGFYDVLRDKMQVGGGR